MYSVTRKVDDKPDGVLRIMIDAPAPEDMKDPPFGLGGTFYFLPGDTQIMQEYSARVIFDDPSLEPRFTVDPPLPEKPKPAEAEPIEPVAGIETPAVADSQAPVVTPGPVKPAKPVAAPPPALPVVKSTKN